MNRNNKKTKGALWSSNIFSVLGISTAACCAGPGLLSCSVACAPACSSVGFSLLGISATSMAASIGSYWYVFLILSLISFSIASYRIFFLNRCKDQKNPKILFSLSLLLSVVLFVRMLI